LEERTKKSASKEQELERSFFNNVSELFGHERELSPKERTTRSLRRLLKQYISDIMLHVRDSVGNDGNEETADEARVVSNISNEDETLESTLHGLFSRKKRYLTIQKHNGKDQTIICRPYMQNSDGFIREAKRSKWIEKLLPDQDYRTSFLRYTAMYHCQDFTNVAKIYDVDIQKTEDTFTTAGLADHLGLNASQLEELRSWLKSKGYTLEHKKAAVRKVIDDEVGQRDTTKPSIGAHMFDQEDLENELCPYWIANIEEDICRSRDSFLAKESRLLRHASRHAYPMEPASTHPPLFESNRFSGNPCALFSPYDSSTLRYEYTYTYWVVAGGGLSVLCSCDDFSVRFRRSASTSTLGKVKGLFWSTLRR
jgi:hypothetical protein